MTPAHPFPHRPDIDGLRALAILPVIFFHLGVAGFSGGFVGVDIFFVISGYLITAIIHREMVEGRFSFVGFFERRVRRIVPALVVVLTVTTIAALVLLLPYDLIELGHSLASAALGVANVFFLKGEGYFDGPSLTKPLLHTWSLSLEEQYYLIFPPLLLALCYAKRGMNWGLGVLAWVSFGAGLWMVAYWPKAAFYLPMFRAWEFLVGAMLALGALPPLTTRLGRSLTGWIGLILILTAVGLLNDRTPTPGWATLLPVLGAGLILYAGSGGHHPVGRVLSWSPLVFVGLISYSLYLWHWPLIVFTRYVTLQPLGVMGQTAILVFSFVLAWTTWRWIERPFRGKSGIGSRRVVFRGAALAAAVFVAITATVEMKQGLPQRVNQRALDLQAQSTPPLNWQRMVLQALPGAGKGSRGIQHQHHPQTLPTRFEPFAGGTHINVGPASAPPEFAVWGDSHAEGFLMEQANSPLARHHGGAFFIRSGCVPLLGLGNGWDRTTCQAFNQRVAEQIVATPSIRTVVLIARWGFYAANAMPPTLLSLENALGGDAHLFKKGMARTQRFFSEHGIKVVWLIDNPTPGWNVPRTMARSVWRGGVLPAMPTLAEIEAQQRPLLEELHVLASSEPITVVDPAPILCPKGLCRFEEGGVPLYRDDNHLSPFGVSKVIPLLEETLLAQLEPERRVSVSP